MAGSKSFFPEALHRYILDHTLRDREILADLRAETAQDPRAVMQISPDQGQLLALLVQAIGAKRCLEIGVFTGYSSLVVALALPPDGKILCCDVNQAWTTIARRYWERAGVAHKVQLRLAPASETLDSLLAAGESGSYDFAFIDADKQNYLRYYEQCLQLVRCGGLIAVDNTLWSGAVADPSDNTHDTVAIRDFNDKLHHDERVTLALVPIADGMTLALKR